MRSFVIGKVLEPQARRTKQGKEVVEFGLLVGRSSETVSIWGDDKCFPLALNLHEGDKVIAIVNSAVDKSGRVRFYVNDLAFAPDGLSEKLARVFEEVSQRPSAAQEPPKKVGA